MKTRNTPRRQSCLRLLKNRIYFLPELRWRVWLSEKSNGTTHAICSRNAKYRQSFEASLNRWQEQDFLIINRLDRICKSITYGMAAQLAIYTILERGQLSSDQSVDRFRLYFGKYWCSVVVICTDELAVNIGAVHFGSLKRYKVISETKIDGKQNTHCLSQSPWPLFRADSGVAVQPTDEFQIEKPTKTFQNKLVLEDSETSSKEGVALAVQRQSLGGISPYLIGK